MLCFRRSAVVLATNRRFETDTCVSEHLFAGGFSLDTPGLSSTKRNMGMVPQDTDEKLKLKDRPGW